MDKANIGNLPVHLSGGVIIPPALHQALIDGNLVVFVGAGASVDPLSSLPLFDGLTAGVLNRAGSTDGPAADKRFDVQLGDLADRPFDVHGAVRQIIGRPDSKPNRWHKALARLFGSPDQVRVVTTNYDLHLEAAFDGGLPVWSAPALPLGHDFHGIVHLHGALHGPDDGWVVTDREFGRAYLTEGWARRFLLPLFQNYFVLFVGYSHDDLVMQYLARGLPSETEPRRFALVDPDDYPGAWGRLRIQPIPWEVDPADEYGPGAKALKDWGERTWWSNLQHDNRIRDLIAGGPPLDPIDGNYLSHCLADRIRVQVFVRCASGDLWLGWIKDEPAFLDLFRRDAELSDAQIALAIWFAEKVVVASPNAAFNVLAEMGGYLSRRLWVEIAYAIWRSPASTSEFAPWIAVLCNHDVGDDDQVLNYLMSKCVLPDDGDPLIVLLRHLFAPRTRLRPGISFPGHPPSVFKEIDVAADRYWVEESMQKVMIPNLDQIAQRVFDVASGALVEYYDLHRSLGEVTTGFDPTSYLRSAIEPSQQDRFNTAADLAIDLAREAAQSLAVSRGSVVVADELVSHNVPILKRLAAWLIAKA